MTPLRALFTATNEHGFPESAAGWLRFSHSARTRCSNSWSVCFAVGFVVDLRASSATNSRMRASSALSPGSLGLVCAFSDGSLSFELGDVAPLACGPPAPPLALVTGVEETRRRQR